MRKRDTNMKTSSATINISNDSANNGIQATFRRVVDTPSFSLELSHAKLRPDVRYDIGKPESLNDNLKDFKDERDTRPKSIVQSKNAIKLGNNINKFNINQQPGISRPRELPASRELADNQTNKVKKHNYLGQRSHKHRF